MLTVKGPFATAYHAPVLYHTVLEYLITDTSGVYVDATAGGGGHVEAILSALSPKGCVIAVDRDADAVHAVKRRLPEAINSKQLMVYQSAFSNLEALVQRYAPVTGLLLDLGVSSYQLDHGPRGFSHRQAAPLDMRMDAESQTTAADIVNEFTEDALRKVLHRWGEEPHARRIAQRIVACRPIETTTELATAVRSAVPLRWESRSVARTFQALRIAVNDEMDELAQVLEASERIVTEGGRLVVISYHSLEDRMVKRILRDGVLTGEAERDIYGVKLVPWQPLTRRPVMPDAAEVAANRRSRSAKLRAGIRCAIPVSDR